jgi:hypothetical protein
MPEPLTVEALALELRKDRLEQRRQGRVLKTHVDECGELQKLTAQRLEQGAQTMDRLDKSLKAIEDRFVLFDRVTTFLSKRGKWVIGLIITAAISAWVSVLVQNYLLHTETARTATVAASSAQEAASGQKQVLHKLNEIAPGP